MSRRPVISTFATYGDSGPAQGLSVQPGFNTYSNQNTYFQSSNDARSSGVSAGQANAPIAGLSIFDLAEQPPPPPPPKSFKKSVDQRPATTASSWLDNSDRAVRQTIGSLLKQNPAVTQSSGQSFVASKSNNSLFSSDCTNSAYHERANMNSAGAGWRADAGHLQQQQPCSTSTSGSEYTAPAVMYGSKSLAAKDKTNRSSNPNAGGFIDLEMKASSGSPSANSNRLSVASGNVHSIASDFQSSRFAGTPASTGNYSTLGGLEAGRHMQISSASSVDYFYKNSPGLQSNTHGQPGSGGYYNNSTGSMNSSNHDAVYAGNPSYPEGNYQSTNNLPQADGYDPAYPLDSSFGKQQPEPGRYDADCGWQGGRNAEYYNSDWDASYSQVDPSYGIDNSSGNDDLQCYDFSHNQRGSTALQQNSNYSRLETTAAPTSWEDVRYRPENDSFADKNYLANGPRSSGIAGEFSALVPNSSKSSEISREHYNNSSEVAIERAKFSSPDVPRSVHSMGKSTSKDPTVTIPPLELGICSPADPIYVNVSNIPTGVPDSLLQRMFQVCGTEEVWQRAKKPDGSLQNFGFCKFLDMDGALRALRLLDGWMFRKGAMKVKVSEYNKKRLLKHINFKHSAKGMPALAMSADFPPLDANIKFADVPFKNKIVHAVQEELGINEIFEGNTEVPTSEKSAGRAATSGATVSGADRALLESQRRQGELEWEAKERVRLTKEFDGLTNGPVTNDIVGRLEAILQIEMQILRREEPDIGTPFCGVCDRNHDWDISCDEVASTITNSNHPDHGKAVDLMPEEVRRILSSVQNILGLKETSNAGDPSSAVTSAAAAIQAPNEAIQRALANLQPQLLSSVVAKTVSLDATSSGNPLDRLDRLSQPLVAASMSSFLTHSVASVAGTGADSGNPAVKPPEPPVTEATFDALDTVLQLMRNQIASGSGVDASFAAGELGDILGQSTAAGTGSADVRLALLNELIESRQKAREKEAKQAELASLVNKMKQGQQRIDTLSSSVKKARPFRESDVEDWPDMVQMMQQADTIDLNEEARTLARIRGMRHNAPYRSSQFHAQFGESLAPPEPWQGFSKRRIGLAHPAHNTQPDTVMPTKNYRLDVGVLEKYASQYRKLDKDPSTKPQLNTSQQIPLGIRIKSGLLSIQKNNTLPVKTSESVPVMADRSSLPVSPLAMSSATAAERGKDDITSSISHKQPGLALEDLSPEELDRRLYEYKSQVFSTLKKQWNSRGGGKYERKPSLERISSRSRSPRSLSRIRSSYSSRSRSPRSCSRRGSPARSRHLSPRSGRFHKDSYARRSRDRSSSRYRRRQSPSIDESRYRRRSNEKSRSPCYIRERSISRRPSTRRLTPPSLMSDLIRKPLIERSRRSEAHHRSPSSGRQRGELSKPHIRSYSPPDYYINDNFKSNASRPPLPCGRDFTAERSGSSRPLRRDALDVLSESVENSKFDSSKRRLGPADVAAAMASLPPELLQKVWKYNLPVEAILNKDPSDLKAHISSLESTESQTSAELAANELFKAFQRISKEDANEPDVVRVSSMFGIGKQTSSGDIALIEDTELQAAPVIKVRKSGKHLGLAEPHDDKKDLRQLLNLRKDMTSRSSGCRKPSEMEDTANDVTVSYDEDGGVEDGDVLKIDDSDDEGPAHRRVTATRSRPKVVGLSKDFYTDHYTAPALPIQSVVVYDKSRSRSPPGGRHQHYGRRSDVDGGSSGRRSRAAPPSSSSNSISKFGDDFFTDHYKNDVN